MAYPQSSYGDRPPLQGYRRSFTLPTRALSVHEKAGLETADADADVLFSHSSARIVSFSPPTDAISSTSKETLPDADYPVDAVEILPWRSHTETLASTGPIVIEKVRGSTYFLKSADQKVIHTVMRNSQCWCVDGESKFVLRIGKFRYYRIELPTETDEDKQKVQELKQALPKVLRYERTPCPFKRAFHVDLPEDAITPRRKGTWKRKALPHPTTPNTDPLPLRRTKTTRAWSLQGDNSATPLHRYGRRGSDYGFDTSRGSSPRPALGGDGYRSATPSSLASSEDAGDAGHEDPSIEDTQQEAEIISEQSTDEDSRIIPSTTVEDWAHLRPSAGTPSDVDSVLESNSDLEARSTEGLLDAEVDPEEQLPPSAIDPGQQNEVALGDLVELTSATTDEETSKDVAAENLSTPDESLLQGNVPEALAQGEHALHHPSSASDAAAVEPPEESEGVAAPLDKDPHISVDQVHETTVDTGVVYLDQDSQVSAREDPSLSRVSSMDSFHTTNSLTEQSLAEHVDAFDSEKTPHIERFDPFSMRSRAHKRELSEMTVTASTVDSYLEPNVELRPPTSDSNEPPATPALARSTLSDSSWPEVQTPSSPAKNEGLRRRLKTERSFSPLPPSTTLFSPGSPTQGNHFTAEILQKACNMALVKPIEAVVLLVHILARIAGGATVNDLINGNLFRRPEQHRRRSSFPDQRSPSRDDTDDEDDFGVPIRGRTRSVGSKTIVSPSREIDGDSMFDLD